MDLIKEFGRTIRTVEHEGTSYYSIIDLCAIAAETEKSGGYWRILKKRLIESKVLQNGYSSMKSTTCNPLQTVTGSTNCIIRKLPMIAADGRERKTDCATRENCLRLLQEIPSPNANKIKAWLAHLGEQRIQEHENPGLRTDRALKHDTRMYEQAGLPKDWAIKRLYTKGERLLFTDEIKRCEGKQYGKHTNTVHFGAFGMDTKEHREFKGISKRDNLRDNMSSSELALIMMAESWAKEDLRKENPTGDLNIDQVLEKTAEHLETIRKASPRAMATNANNKEYLKIEARLTRERKKLEHKKNNGQLELL